MRNLIVGRGRSVRVGPWRGDHDETASIATFVDQPLDEEAVSAVVDHLVRHGYRQAMTAALGPAEHGAFVANGFSPVRNLTLLRRPLDGPVRRREPRMRRWRRRRFDPILAVDHAAFDPFWRFDHGALREALDATPHRLLRVDSVVQPRGYALSGVARSRAYLQRLAVHPEAAGRGLGSALLLDALHWMRWRGAEEAFVNTQDDNERATALYLRHGFEPEPEGLVIFGRSLDGSGPGALGGAERHPI